MATETSRSSSSSADSYIGSLISLTSKSEIRYEGILYNINTEESSIGLTNVRSFGTEGRKKDGPQLMPSDKVYEYILFRGSDIKDLQVKSSQPVQPTQSINSDPAIIQSHYPRPPTTSSTAGGPTTNNLGQPGSTYPLYQPGGNIGSWAPSPSPLPPNPNTSGPTMPMYWPGYYAPPPQLHQQSLPRPPQGLPMPPSLQYPTFNPPPASSEPLNFPEYPSPLLPTSSPLPSSFTGSLPSLMHNKTPNPSAPPLPGGATMQPPPAVTSDVLSGAKFPFQGMSQAMGGPTEPPTPLLVTPGQLLQSVPTTVSPPPVHDDVEVVPVSSMTSSSSSPPPPPLSVPVSVPEAQPPILPLPTQSQIAQKPNGSSYQNRHNYNYRGRERGRGSAGGSRPVMKFTEEFDFNAMNEKFNKDEVWGTLGKTNRSGSKEKDGNVTDEEESEEETDPNLPKVEVKPVYSKDDFFDSLSSNSLDRQSNYGRTRFSEQMKLDTETFGEFSRYRGGGRGGRGPYRGGRGRGGGGGYYGRGYGYVGRGRGGRNQNPNPNPNQNQNQNDMRDY
ncbi:protein decapping 5 [Lactuca sativa]|uniref:DFDF domain-containing protein n=1 Tax=Lactuca sativa TaxID=4236 RepID=A0A9R1W0G0_LACSA|nr:protein decapping 5 [Lactuca sativa]KAJ0216005.1 hypothetical protein LSAT_V11C300125110 [Lactuca sativa]